MNVLTTILLLLTGGAAGCGIATLRSAASVSASEEQMLGQIDYWRAEAVRATAEAIRANQESKIRAEGCQQGKDDLIKTLRLVLRVQQDTTATWQEPDDEADHQS